jgi:hypothetical protein
MAQNLTYCVEVHPFHYEPACRCMAEGVERRILDAHRRKYAARVNRQTLSIDLWEHQLSSRPRRQSLEDLDGQAVQRENPECPVLCFGQINSLVSKVNVLPAKP